MSPHEAIEFIRKRLKRRHLQYWFAIGLTAFLHVLGFSLLLSFLSHAGAFAFFSASACGCVYWALRHACFRTYSALDAAKYLDEKTESKDRFKSFVELKEFSQDAAKSQLLESQLAEILKEPSRSILPKLEMPKAFYAALWALLVPWCGLLAFIVYQKSLPKYNLEQVAILEQLLQKEEELPPKLREKLETLKNSLEEHPLLDAPVSDALAEAQEELKQSFEDKALEEQEAKERIIEETESNSAMEKSAPEEPSPTATPQAKAQQDFQTSKSEEKQTETESEKQAQQEEQNKSKAKSQEENKQEGQGKDAEKQSQSKEQSKSAQGDGQGEGEAAGQGQTEQQSGQGSGEKESSAKQDSLGSQAKEQGEEQSKGESKETDSKDKKAEGDSQSKQGKEGAKEAEAKKEKNGFEGSEKSEGNKEGSGLDETKKALNQIKDQIEKEKQPQKQEGKQKESKSQKEEKESLQQEKDQSQSSADNNDKKKSKGKTSSEKDQGQQGEEKSKPKEEQESKNESASDTAEKSSMPVPSEIGKTPDLNMVLGTKEQERQRSKDLELPAEDERFDSRFAGKEGELVQNKKGLSPKTGLADVQLAKPEARKGVEEQYIPPEYEGVFSAR